MLVNWLARSDAVNFVRCGCCTLLLHLLGLFESMTPRL